MGPFSAVVLCAVIAAAGATDVQQCPGRSISGLSENVQLTPCKSLPCRLKKGTDQHITVQFTTDKELKQITNSVGATVFGLSLPFIGVDGISICDKIFLPSGEKTACPLKAGGTYVYKDSFPILKIYPSTNVKVHWALVSEDKQFVCFEVPARIV